MTAYNDFTVFLALSFVSHSIACRFRAIWVSLYQALIKTGF